MIILSFLTACFLSFILGYRMKAWYELYRLQEKIEKLKELK